MNLFLNKTADGMQQTDSLVNYDKLGSSQNRQMRRYFHFSNNFNDSQFKHN